MKNVTDLKRDMLKDFDNLVNRLSKGHPIVDLDPIIRKIIFIDFMENESLQDGIMYSLIESLISNDTFKK